MSRLKTTMMAGTALTALALAAPAQADMITINSILTSWQNPVTPPSPPFPVTITNQAGQLPDTISWGVPFPAGATTGQSAYIFDPVEIPAMGGLVVNTAPPPNLAGLFALGTFTHQNNPIFIPALTSVELDFDVGGVFMPTPLSATFNFAHNETPNNPPPAGCCDDIVTVSNAFFNTPITVGTEDYFFTLLGFSTNGGVTISTMFTSPEGGNNSAVLYAVITDTPIIVTPEPVSLSLLGLGLFGLGVAARRRR